MILGVIFINIDFFTNIIKYSHKETLHILCYKNVSSRSTNGVDSDLDDGVLAL